MRTARPNASRSISLARAEDSSHCTTANDRSQCPCVTADRPTAHVGGGVSAPSVGDITIVESSAPPLTTGWDGRPADGVAVTWDKSWDGAILCVSA